MRLLNKRKIKWLGFYVLLLACVSCNNKPTTASRPIMAKTDTTKKLRGWGMEEQSDSTLIFPTINKAEILKRCYDSPIIDSNGYAVWQPNYYERLNFNLSSDNKCHTIVDTIMYFTDKQKDSCAVVIFATYSLYIYDTIVEVNDGHFNGALLGIALLSKVRANQWIIYDFKKSFTTLGYFGTYHTGREDAGKICLKQIGDKWTCLSLTQGIGGTTGCFSGYESLYSIERYHLDGTLNNFVSNILQFNYWYSNGLDGVYEEEKSKLTFIKNKNSYYDIVLTTKKTKSDSIHSTSKTIVDHYIFSPETDVYIKK